eukprot:6175395-Amphidinium_carterae.1
MRVAYNLHRHCPKAPKPHKRENEMESSKNTSQTVTACDPRSEHTVGDKAELSASTSWQQVFNVSIRQ